MYQISGPNLLHGPSKTKHLCKVSPKHKVWRAACQRQATCSFGKPDCRVTHKRNSGAVACEALKFLLLQLVSHTTVPAPAGFGDAFGDWVAAEFLFGQLHSLQSSY